jgi:hypothetical protein
MNEKRAEPPVTADEAAKDSAEFGMTATGFEYKKSDSVLKEIGAPETEEEKKKRKVAQPASKFQDIFNRMNRKNDTIDT